MLSSESAAEPGKWDTSRAPYQRGIMDAITDPTVREIWVMKSAQVGWTEIVNNVIGYHVDLDPAPMLVVQPSIELAEAWSKDRLAPMIRDTPCLQGKIADAKSRDSGNTILHKSFRGGRLTIAGANAPRGLASRPIRIVLFDEIDGYPASAGTEGDPIALGKKRLTTFWNRKMLAGSTPTIKGSSRIEHGFMQSDQRYYFVPCPHCGEKQRLVWSQVRWPEGRPEEACYVCQHCGTEIDDAGKAWFLGYDVIGHEADGTEIRRDRGEWRGTKPFDGRAGFHISELYSPWSTWAQMATSFVLEKKLPETLQTWINTSLGETWEDSGETLEPKGLLSRAESYNADSVPSGVRLITLGVDVQDDRLEATFFGWGDDEEAWRLGHRVLRGDPGQAALWLELEQLVLAQFATEDGRTLLVEATCVDSGGHFTQQVYSFAMKHKRRRVFAIKGAGGQGRLAWPKKAGKAKGKNVAVWLIGVDTIKALIYGRLKRIPQPGPGYIHFDADTDQEWLEQLTSETVVLKMSQGRRVRMWRPRATGIRQEALDCTVYAYAAMIARGGAQMLAQRANKAAKAAEADATEQAPPVVEAPAPSLATVARQQKQRAARGLRPRVGWAKGY